MNDSPVVPLSGSKTQADLSLIFSSFRLEGERVIRLSNRKEAKGTLDGTTGYLSIRAGLTKDGSRRKLKLHRVKYALAHGRLPQFIDHIDGDRQNNAISNLREATASQNSANLTFRNRPLPKSGYRNVRRLPNGKFEWRVKIEGVMYSDRPFDTAFDAKEAVEVFKRMRREEYYVRYSRRPITIRAFVVKTAPKATKVRTVHLRSGSHQVLRQKPQSKGPKGTK